VENIPQAVQAGQPAPPPLFRSVPFPLTFLGSGGPFFLGQPTQRTQ